MATMTSTQAQWQLILLIAHARAKPSKLPGEVHHVIPRSVWKVLHKQGKTTVPQHCPVRQLVFLSHQQHLMAHFLLWQVHRGHKVFGPKMACAFTLMMRTIGPVGKPTPAMQAAFAKAQIACAKAAAIVASKTHKGKVVSASTRAKISAGWTPARKATAAKATSTRMKGVPKSTAHKAKMSAQRRGKKQGGLPRKPVIHIPTGRVWPSILAAAKSQGLSIPSMASRIQRGSFGGAWQFAPQCKICGAGLPQGTPKGAICKVCMGV